MLEVEVLRCFKTDKGIYGEYFVIDTQGRKTLILQNENSIKGFMHLRDKKVDDCLLGVTQEVKDAIKKASDDYLASKEVGK